MERRPARSEIGERQMSAKGQEQSKADDCLGTSQFIALGGQENQCHWLLEEKEADLLVCDLLVPIRVVVLKGDLKSRDMPKPRRSHLALNPREHHQTVASRFNWTPQLTVFVSSWFMDTIVLDFHFF